MLISLSKDKCVKCGRCLQLMKEYCISEKDGYPVFNKDLCNTCQKCVSICPSQAILVNNTLAVKIDTSKRIPSYEELTNLLERRRSIKKFSRAVIEEDKIEKIISGGLYAPNQNKNISVTVITDKRLISEINREAISFVRKIYNMLFKNYLTRRFICLFADDIEVIKIKMEYDLKREKVVKENTQALIVLSGNSRVPVTETSAHHMLSFMIITAESLGVGNCLMDSLLHTLNTDSKLKKQLAINEKILGVLALGYSAEDILNIPKGYKAKVKYFS